MGGRVDEEVEAVVQAFGHSHTTLAGFYSNGEISPHIGAMDCKLHNQTMTITLVSQSGLVEPHGQPHTSDCA
jgi:small ligand-binding sensory domain FIST